MKTEQMLELAAKFGPLCSRRSSEQLSFINLCNRNSNEEVIDI